MNNGGIKMKKLTIRKMTVTLIIICMIFSSFSFINAAESVSDIKGHWAESQLNSWKDKGLIKGYEDGTIKPNHSITRAEFMALVNRSFAFTEKDEVDFSDVSKADWAYEEVAKAIRAGYIEGYTDGSIGLNKEISRQEVAVIIGKLLKLQATDNQEAAAFKDFADFAVWSKGAIEAVVESKIMQGYGADQTFKSGKPITRAEAVVTLDRALEKRSVTYNNAGTFGPENGTTTVDNNVVVNTSGVILQNMVINGNLLLAEGIGSGDAFLKNVTVKGTTTVNGGGKNSIHFENSILVTIIVDKKDGTVRIVAEGTTSVAQVTVKSPVTVEESNETGDGFKAVTLTNELPADSKVILLGTFDSLDVLGKKLNIVIPEGNVKIVNIGESATESSIELGKDATIVKLILDVLLKVIGQGTIEQAIIGASGADSTFEKQPEKKELKGEEPTPTPVPTVIAIPTSAPSSNSNIPSSLSNAKVIIGTTIGVLSNGNIINVPASTKVDAFKTGLSVSPNAGVEILTGTGGSAVTNQSATDVTATMVIEVTAEDATIAEYSITLAAPVASNANAITAFSFTQQTGAATIDANTHTIDIEVVNGTDVTALQAAFTYPLEQQ
jgi:hypothetical protein